MLLFDYLFIFLFLFAMTSQKIVFLLLQSIEETVLKKTKRMQEILEDKNRYILEIETKEKTIEDLQKQKKDLVELKNKILNALDNGVDI
jgi:hypothetical protein